VKAIKTTEKLTVDKMELHSHASMTEAKENLSHATQSVLMALDETDSSTNLKDIVGKSAIAELTEQVGHVDDRDADATANTEFDMDLDSSIEDDKKLNNEELLGNHAAMLSHAAVDTIYTSKMHQCKFPFIYNGQKFFHCKQSVHGSWCATHVDKETSAVQKWDYCVLNQHAVALAKQAAMEAAKMEIKRVLAATGAQLTPDSLRESLQAAAAAQAPSVPEDKDAEKPDEEDLKSRKPVMGDVQAAQKVDKLINQAATEKA